MQVQLTDLEYAYKREKDAKVKERILLIMLIKEGMKPAHAAKQLHMAKSWAYTWRERYEADGIEGLKDKPRSGRPPRIGQRLQVSIRKQLRSYPYGWKTREVIRLIYKRAGVIYSETHICRLLHRWGFRRKVPIKSHFGTASMEEEDFKKRLLK